MDTFLLSYPCLWLVTLIYEHIHMKVGAEWETLSWLELCLNLESVYRRSLSYVKYLWNSGERLSDTLRLNDDLHNLSAWSLCLLLAHIWTWWMGEAVCTKKNRLISKCFYPAASHQWWSQLVLSEGAGGSFSALRLTAKPPRAARLQNSLKGENRAYEIVLCVWHSLLCVVGQVPKESEVMLEDLSLCVLLVTAHAQWDYG